MLARQVSARRSMRVWNAKGQAVAHPVDGFDPSTGSPPSARGQPRGRVSCFTSYELRPARKLRWQQSVRVSIGEGSRASPWNAAFRLWAGEWACARRRSRPGPSPLTWEPGQPVSRAAPWIIRTTPSAMTIVHQHAAAGRSSVAAERNALATTDRNLLRERRGVHQHGVMPQVPRSAERWGVLASQRSLDGLGHRWNVNNTRDAGLGHQRAHPVSPGHAGAARKSEARRAAAAGERPAPMAGVDRPDGQNTCCRASAAATWTVKMATSGKFHGLMQAHGPRAVRRRRCSRGGPGRVTALKQPLRLWRSNAGSRCDRAFGPASHRS